MRWLRARVERNGGLWRKIAPRQIFARDGWRCQHCGSATPERLMVSDAPDAPTLDHVRPLSRGGEHAWWNLELLCRACNAAKGDSWAIEDFLAGERPA